MGTDRPAGRSRVIAREWPSRAFRVVVGIWAFALAALVLGAAVADLPGIGIVELTAFVVPVGLLLPIYFLGSHVVVRATDSELRVALWPLVFPARVPVGAVRTVEVRVGAARRHHGGFVPVVGPAHERVLGFDQDAEVRITDGSADEPCHLSILTDRAEGIAEVIRETCQAGAGVRALDVQGTEDETAGRLPGRPRR